MNSKSLLSYIIILCFMPTLTGCASVYSNHKTVEQLLIMETMGLDYFKGGALVSLASAAISTEGGESSEPVRLSGTGSSISSAIGRIHTHATGKDIFCSHTSHILVGENAAKEDIKPFLSYVCRSPDMRLDVPVFVVRGESAETAVKCAGDETKGITELLKSIQDNLQRHGGGKLSSAATLLRDIERYGGALVSTIECKPTEPGGSIEDGCSIDYSGYGVIQGGRLCAFIPRSEAIGVDFLKDDVAVCDISAENSNGGVVTFEVSEGSTSFSPVWDESGALIGLDVNATVAASIMEIDDSFDRNDGDMITALLEDAVSSQIRYNLLLTKHLGVDFLGLAGRVNSADPYKFSNIAQSFPDQLKTLQFRVSVAGRLTHTNDVKGV